MKKCNKSKDTIENTWMKLESIFDIPSKKPSGKIINSYRKNQKTDTKPRNKSNQINKDSPEPTIRATTPSLYIHKSTQTLKGISQSQLKNLYHAKCEDLNIPVLPDQQFRFFSFCSKHFLDRKFEMQESGLGLISSSIIGEILLENTYFAYIILGKNMMGDLGCVSLAKFLQKSTSIVHLDLSSNNLTPEGSEKVLKILSGHPSLVSIDLSSHEGLHRNRLCSNGAIGVNILLLKSQIISHINISGTALKDGLNLMTEGLEQSKSLVGLDLSSNSIQSDQVKVLINAVFDSNLEILNLSNNFIYAEGCEYVSKYLVTNPPLCTLDLSGANLNSRGFHLLFVSLPNNSHLRFLNLSNNQIGKVLSDEIIYMLTINCTIQKLDLSSCMLKNTDLLILSQGIAKNKSIKVLKLNNNAIGDSGVEGLSLALSSNQILQVLDLSKNKVKDCGTRFLAKTFSVNSTLEELNLKENMIKDEGALSLNDSVKLSPSILFISLELNEISCRILDQIQEKLKKNQMNRKKNLKNLIKKQVKVSQYDENAMKSIIQKTHQKKKEKEEIKNRIEKNVEKLEELRQLENNKLAALRENLNELAIKYSSLSVELEEAQRLSFSSKAQHEKEVIFWKNKHDLIDKEIGELILKKSQILYKRDLAKNKTENLINHLKEELDNQMTHKKNLEISYQIWKKKLQDSAENLKRSKNPGSYSREEGKSAQDKSFLASEGLAATKKQSYNDFPIKKRLKTKSM